MSCTIFNGPPLAPASGSPASRSDRPVWRRKTSSSVGSARLIDLRADVLVVEQPQQLRQRRAAVLDVQADIGAVRGELAHDRAAIAAARAPVRSRARRRARRSTTASPPTSRFSSTRAALGDDLAVVDDRHPVAERVGLLEVVGGEKHRRAAVAQAADVLPEVGPVLRDRVRCSARRGTAPGASGRSRARRRAAGAARPNSVSTRRSANSARSSSSISSSARRLTLAASPPYSRPWSTRFSRPVASSSAPPSWLT